MAHLIADLVVMQDNEATLFASKGMLHAEGGIASITACEEVSRHLTIVEEE